MVKWAVVLFFFAFNGLADSYDDPIMAVARADAAYHALSKKSLTDPTVFMATRAWADTYEQTGDVDAAHKSFLAVRDYGQKLSKIYGTGGSAKQKETLARTALSEAGSGALAVGGVLATDPRVKITLIALERLKRGYEKRAELEEPPPPDAETLHKLQNDVDFARRYFDQQQSQLRRVGRLDQTFEAMDVDEFNQNFDRIATDPNALVYFLSHIELISDFKNAGTVEDLLRKNPTWEDRITGKNTFNLLQKLKAKIEEGAADSKETKGLVRDVKIFLEQFSRKTEKDLDKVKEDGSALSVAVEALAERIEGGISLIELEREERKLREAAQAKAEEARRIDEENLAVFDSVSNVLSSFGKLSKNPDVLKVTQTLSGLSQCGKHFYELSRREPVSKLGQVGLTLDYFSLGMQLVSLAMDPGPSDTELILEQIANFSKMVNSRLDRIESSMGSYHELAMMQFQRVTLGIADLRSGQAEARAQLIQIQVSLNELSRAVYRQGDDLKDLEKRRLWQRLDDVVALRIAGQKLVPEADVVSDALAVVAGYATGTSLETAFIEREDFAGRQGLADSLALLEVHQDPYETLDQILRIGNKPPFDLEFPEIERVPHASYWRAATEAYLKLFERNRVSYLHRINVGKELDALAATGSVVQLALRHGRDLSRFEKISAVAESQLRALVATAWQEWIVFEQQKLLSLPGNAEKLKASIVFPQGVVLERPMVVGSIDDRIERDPKYVWEFVPPALQAINHIILSTDPSASDAQKKTELVFSVKRVGWRVTRDGKSHLNWTAFPVLEVTVQSPLLKEALVTRIDTEAVSVKIAYKGGHPRFFDLHPPEEVNRLHSEYLDANSQAQEMQQKIQAGWEQIAVAHLKKHPTPWARSREAVIRLIEVLRAVRIGFRESLLRFISIDPSTRNETPWSYLSKAGKQTLADQVDGLRATQTFLRKNLVLFLPDYFVASREDLLEGGTPGVESAVSALGFLFAEHAKGVTIPLSSNQIVGEEAPTDRLQAHFISKHLRVGDGFTSGVAAWLAKSEGVHPQCVAVDSMLSRIEEAKAQNREFIKIWGSALSAAK